ncbi:MAG: hypothetical protein QOF01_877 [Thermomicrobiales bacterium]|jgi:hypothetical protein|nr:hypothetical protein [Thermomicrobiales bacterium]
MGLGVDRRVGHDAGRAVLLVPDAAAGVERGAVEGDGPPVVGERGERAEQVRAQAGDPLGEPVWDRRQAALPGAPPRDAAPPVSSARSRRISGVGCSKTASSAWTVGRRLRTITTSALRKRRSE